MPVETESSNIANYLSSFIRDVPDFPKPGIIFKDITPLLKSPEALRASIQSFADQYRETEIDVIAGIESRGFIFGTPLAAEMRVPFVPIRKAGKLPWRTHSVSYALEYGEAEVEIHEDAVQKGDRVLLIDDLLATGGTARAACSLVDQAGGVVVACAFLIELTFLKGREKLKGQEIFCLVEV